VVAAEGVRARGQGILVDVSGCGKWAKLASQTRPKSVKTQILTKIP